MFNWYSFGLNFATLYTIGNYHNLKYGHKSFLALYLGGCLAGHIFTQKRVTHEQRRSYQYSSLAGASTLIGYNLFKNPQWFKFVKPIPLLAAMLTWSMIYEDRMTGTGTLAGWALFLAGI